VFDLRVPSFVRRYAATLVVTLSVCLAIGVVVLVRVIDAEQFVKDTLAWIEAQGVWAPLFLVLFQWACVVSLAPDLFISFIAGYLVGFWLGLGSIALGTTLGALTAFLLARFVLSARVAKWRERSPKFAALERGFTRDGWKIAMFRCMVPFFPFKLSNYVFGVSDLRVSHFASGTFLGILPLATVSVYLGSVSADLTMVQQRGPMEWTLIALGGVLLIIFAVYLMRRARKILIEYTDNIEPLEEHASCG
jgi:uncharacterized membrane protein YdjX (TVP38/TMEM64 family)